jgi:hypothetical protein
VLRTLRWRLRSFANSATVTDLVNQVSRSRFCRRIPLAHRFLCITIGVVLFGLRPVSGQDATAPATGSPDRVIISERAIRHIEERHWPDSPAQGAGKFAPGITEDSLRQLVGQAVESGHFRQNSHGRPGQIYEYDFGHPIGITINGRPAYRLRVVLNRWNELITAFPF